jgi:hypothetical protein
MNSLCKSFCISAGSLRLCTVSSFVRKFLAVRMLADKTAPQSDGMFAVPRIWLLYRAFEDLIAHYASTAYFCAAKKG